MGGLDRKRLAREVISRRVELGMNTTKALAEKAQLSPRMLGDVENGRRDNFSPGAKAQIERALRWDAGSIDAVLTGKSPRVSSVIRDRSGQEVERWTSIEGSEQEDLELYRLAYVIMDTRDLVRSQKGPLMTALTALLDEAADLVLKSVARRRSGRDDIEDLDLEDARWFIEETRETNNIRRQGAIYVIDDDENARLDGGAGNRLMRNIASQSDDSAGAELDVGRGMDQAKRDFLDRRKVLNTSLLNHYREMYRRAADQRQPKVLVDQARKQLGDEDPDITFAHEIGDAAYVEYLAARLSTPYQGGDPDLYDAVSLSHAQYQAARARYRREFAEMIVFGGRLRTLGSPNVTEYATSTDDATPPASEADPSPVDLAWRAVSRFVESLEADETEQVGAFGAKLEEHLKARRKVDSELVKPLLLGHYGEMYRRAMERRRTTLNVEQAREELGENLSVDASFDPGIDDAGYAEYLALRLSVPDGAEPPRHGKPMGIDSLEHLAARLRFEREFAEMILFDGKLRTAGAPAVGEYAIAALTRNAEPPDLADAARKLRPGERRAQPEQGEAGGEESQLDADADGV
jgi:hypothetical protein